MFGLKSKVKSGKLFIIADLEPKLRRIGVSERHLNEHFRTTKTKSWDELDGIMKKLGFREKIQDVIGLPPHIRKEVELHEAKIAKENKKYEEDLEKNKFESIRAEIIEERESRVRSKLSELVSKLEILADHINTAEIMGKKPDPSVLEQKKLIEKQMEKIRKEPIKVSDKEVKDRISGKEVKVEDPKNMSMQDYLKLIPSEFSKANINMQLSSKNSGGNRYLDARNDDFGLEYRRPKIEEQRPKPVVSDDDLNWLKSIPSEVEKSRQSSKSLAKDSDIAGDFVKAGGER